jgi:hypothetical protein
MCFYDDDCDWTAEVHTEVFERAAESQECCDCHQTIAAGEWCLRVEQQQFEECQICGEWSDSDEAIVADREYYDTDEEHVVALAELAEHTCTFGEQWTGSICRRCLLIRAAIYDLETKEGCPEHARQPSYGELEEAMQIDTYKFGDRKYTNHALAMFPELSEQSLVAGSLV